MSWPHAYALSGVETQSVSLVTSNDSLLLGGSHLFACGEFDKRCIEGCAPLGVRLAHADGAGSLCRSFAFKCVYRLSIGPVPMSRYDADLLDAVAGLEQSGYCLVAKVMQMQVIDFELLDRLGKIGTGPSGD